MEKFPHLLVLDFDGVICDGLQEYFQTSRQVCRQIWPTLPPEKLDRQKDNFYRLRPVIETGWEMPLLLQALATGIDPATIERAWSTVAQTLQNQEQISKAQLAPALDQVRDNYINNDLAHWLELHRFYPGVIGQLNHWLQSPYPQWLYIVTTKEGRFVQQLLQNQKVNFPLGQIIGKEIKQPKYKTLQQLLAKHSYASDQLWFVEDMLTTLQTVADQPVLGQSNLFLADWGYNTITTRESAKNNQRFHLLSLRQLSCPFGQWQV
ncbi:HAD family hydrolase [Synechocystis salina LEGE 06099]|uniref:HAD family hydrolase n=1 Tax=Synechocystis salina TaxID=945780 RepID=UPI00188204B5|nr:HAD family hydrolase [Synechocystis salina]MBE9203164.1 HAD family hydrolase [Synechocystis salina LEGE 06099]